MTEEQYYQIAAACDKILLRVDATIEWVAIPWLHIINEHPIFIAKYADLIEDSPLTEDHNDTLHSFSRIIADIPASADRIARLAGNVIKATAHKGWENALEHILGVKTRISHDPSRVDVIIVSWLVNVSHLQRDDDFYFGNLQSILADRGLSSLLVLRNQTGHPTNQLLEQAYKDGICSRLILPDINSRSKELTFLRKCKKAHRQLRHAEVKAESFLERRIYRKAGNLIMKKAVKNLRLHSQIADLCRRMRPSVIITLYEGHAWERCVYHAAHTSSFPIFCVGYQHTIIRKHSYALRRSLGFKRGFDPDLIVTTGEVTRQILKSFEDLKRIPIVTYGTHRIKRDNLRVDTPRSKDAFLVLPEGIESECICLFEFALKCARILPEAHFILRTHPVFPFKRLKDKLRAYYPPPDNVEVSRKESIEEDFTRAGFLLYRGSSTVIYAIQQGLKPFYVAMQKEMNIDPLYELTKWREYVSSEEDLVSKYKSYQRQGSSASIGDWQRARDFCNRYVQPVRTDAIDEIIKLAHKARKTSARELH